MSGPGYCLLLLPLLALHIPVHAADTVKVRELRTQKVGDVTYFHVRLALASETTGSDVRLVSPDGKARHIYARSAFPNIPDAAEPEKKSGEKPAPLKPREPVPVESPEFVGKAQGQDEIKLILLSLNDKPDEPERSGRKRKAPPSPWSEANLTLDLRKGKEVALPKEAKARLEKQESKGRVEPPVRDDLEGLWAEAQVAYFMSQQPVSGNFGFHGVAAEATVRKYKVPNRVIPEGMVPYQVTRAVVEERDGKPLTRTFTETRYRWMDRKAESDDGLRRLYDMTTGTAAIAEALALRRMNSVATKEDGKRTVEISKVKGIDVAEHPWAKMMAGKKPADEPLAKLIPHDNYYLHFKNAGKLLDLGDMVGKSSAFQNRDFRIKERYFEQLCLRKGMLGRRAGSLLLKGVAVTGSDPYLREGSDLTLVFHVNNKDIFLAGLKQFLDSARKKHGDDLKETKSEYLDIAIESFVTPLREVSLHRAVVDDYVICSNSPVGLRRVLDAHKGKIKRLSEALDFQYMRTVFRADDKEEDGFLFLSDAFIRQLVGPASKIKEKRRLEALTSFYMLTHGALFTAWETGKLPDSHKTTVAGANLKSEELPMPEGKPAVWDARRQAAHSETYNTIHFATPLIELPLDKVTQAEQEQYNRFRLEYLDLWRQYFDPVGMRFSVSDKQVKVETYILPLVKNSKYDSLRRFSGGGTFRLDPGHFSPDTLFQFVMHMSPNIKDRTGLFGEEAAAPGLNPVDILMGALGPIGSWVLVRVDDSPAFSKMIELSERAERLEDIDSDEMMRLAFESPFVLGVDIKNPLTFGVTLATFRTAMTLSLPGGLTWEPLEKTYKGVPIVRVQASAAVTQQLLKLDGKEGRKRFQPAVYYAMIDGGFYLALNEKMLHSLVDQMEARKKGEARSVPVNTSLYLSPAAARESAKLLRMGLESRMNQKALENLPLWETLYRCGVIPEKSGKQEAAYRYLGFVPVSPDGSAYRLDASRDEVVNERHGTTRKPTLRKTLAEDAPLARLLEQLRSIRADLRFREDGIHTVVTIDRQKPVK